jgi:hypothetical protein
MTKGEVKLKEYGEVVRVRMFSDRPQMKAILDEIKIHYNRLTHKRPYEIIIKLNTDHINIQ